MTVETAAIVPSRRKRSVRHAVLLVHRYLGLTMLVFLVVSGLTGSLLAFNEELDVALNPELYHVEVPSDGRAPLDAFELRDKAFDLVPPGSHLPILPLNTPPNQAMKFWVELPANLQSEAHDTEYFLDPYTGELKGSRRWGDPTQGRAGFMPFVYYLHYSLALGTVGKTILGIISLLWTVDCFAGAYLTFPISSGRKVDRNQKSWLLRWLPSWRLQAQSLFSLIFTWHRASGLWVWALLLVFAWSGVALNLHDVYEPVMKALCGPAPDYAFPKRDVPLEQPKLSMREAYEKARQSMSEKADRDSVELYSERMLRYKARGGFYEYRVYSSRDITKRYANSAVWIDGKSGAELGSIWPTGENVNATVGTWLLQLHFGTITAGGWAYRVLLSIVGVGVAVLSLSGAWFWWRRRRRSKFSRAATPEE